MLWFVPGTGEGVYASVAEAARVRGLLEPVADGLFPDATQTFVERRAP